MTRRLGLIVTDASPLITLAAGDALDCLTMPGVPVIINEHRTGYGVEVLHLVGWNGPACPA
jgi:hypothetical protein